MTRYIKIERNIPKQATLEIFSGKKKKTLEAIAIFYQFRNEKLSESWLADIRHTDNQLVTRAAENIFRVSDTNIMHYLSLSGTISLYWKNSGMRF